MPPKKGKKSKKQASNVFSMFEPSQIQEFKEAFGMIDANRDGFIDKNDLLATYESLGASCLDSTMDAMLAEAPGPINFTVFLNMLADKLHGTDSEEVIGNAFKVIKNDNNMELSAFSRFSIPKTPAPSPPPTLARS
jgi:myosin regulatory light chain 12